MNENINLREILKGHKGETFYSPTFGELILQDIGWTLLFKRKNDVEIILLHNGKWATDSEDISVFPSKDQRDWIKWDEENNHKTPKTWSELIKIIGDNWNIYVYEENAKSPIEKSALALLKIHQLIEVGYGGNVTDEEWKNNDTKYAIVLFKDEKDFSIDNRLHLFSHITFHTKEQAEEFLSYPENVQLLKDYFMMN